MRRGGTLRHPDRSGLLVLEKGIDLGLCELHPSAVEIIVDQDLHAILQKGAAKRIEFPRVRSRILISAAAVL
jgi:hypothetical protein